MENTLSLIGIFGSIVTWLTILALVLFIPRNRKPSSAIAWLLVIFFLPVVGLILFAVIGSPKLSKRRQQQQKDINKKLELEYGVSGNVIPESAVNGRFKDIVKLNQTLGGMPLGYAKSVKIIPEYNDAISDITKSVKKSQKTVYIEYFILALDDTTKPLFNAMADAVERGVEVKVLFDAIGSRGYPNFSNMKEFMTQKGIDWRPMLPIKLRPKHYNRPDLRNHRKVVAIDGEIGYIGSQNMIDRTYHRKDDIYYDELVAKVTGKCVEQFEIVFSSDWYFETNEMLVSKSISKNNKVDNIALQLIPSGSTYSTENNALLFTELIHKAQKEIVITNPYFVPNEAIFDAIKSASYRGVKVKIVNSQAMDQWMVGHAMRSFYSQLLNAGVEIYLFKEPKLLHSKHITVDDDICLIGSSNMDIRSFELNLECVMVVYDRGVTRELKKVELRNIKNSKLVNLKDWSKRPFWQEFRDSIARLSSAVQ